MTMEIHDAAVSLIAQQVRRFSEKKKPFRIYHGSTNSTRTSQRRADNTIDTSQLTHVLSVDTASKTALVEPNVPMDALVDATLAHSLVPPVVMEFPGITAGGGFSGMAGESSSFRHGAFDATMRSIEIVLPNGQVAYASKTDRPELFWGAASAFGTLGVVTLLEVELRDAREYVELTYSLTTNSKDTVQAMGDAAAMEETDYIDGIVFSKDATVICTGKLTDDLPKGTVPQRFSRRSDPWFYIRARDVLKQLKKNPAQEAAAITVVDYIPLRDYLFRYDRGGFWVAKYAFRYFLAPFNRITRTALDRFMHARVMYRAVHKSGLADTHMVQDVGVPYAAVADFTDWLDAELAIYPLWLCPLRVQRAGGPDAQHGLHSDFGRPHAPNLMNFGVWGAVPGDRRAVVARNRDLERKVQALGGKKWLYAHAYYPEDEFWAHYDRASYDALRAKYHAEYLPSVYDKVKVDVDAEEAAVRATWRTRAAHQVKEIWPVRGLYGFYKAVVGGEYLLQKTVTQPVVKAEGKAS